MAAGATIARIVSVSAHTVACRHAAPIAALPLPLLPLLAVLATLELHWNWCTLAQISV